MPKLTPDTDRIIDLIHEDAWTEIAEALAHWHPADIADVIERAPKDDQDRLFNLLSDELKPDVLSELEAEAETGVLDSLTNAELS